MGAPILSAHGRMTFLAIVLAWTWGCSAYRIKSAADLPEARLSTIQGSEKLALVPYPLSPHSVWIEGIDGEKDPGGYYAVDPGIHIVQYIVHYGWLGICSGNFLIEVREGKQYILEAEIDRETIEMVLKDKNAGVVAARTPCADKESRP